MCARCSIKVSGSHAGLLSHGSASSWSVGGSAARRGRRGNHPTVIGFAPARWVSLRRRRVVHVAISPVRHISGVVSWTGTLSGWL